MIDQTPFNVDLSLINRALQSLPNIDFRLSLNEPTGNFFYDHWKIKEEFKGTDWELILNTLPIQFGEARIIRLQGANCYFSHADIDDRYHLNLNGDKCYLVDLDLEVMHPIKTDGAWYNMNAGKRHSAINFGNRPRHQLVVRHLLIRGNLKNPVTVSIMPRTGVDLEDARFLFDDIVSPWLSNVNKDLEMDNFSYQNSVVSFDISSYKINDLKKILPPEFEIK